MASTEAIDKAEVLRRLVKLHGMPIQKPDWLRADIYTGDIYIDCTKRLPFPDNSVDLFFFEHLHYEPAVQFLSEIYRTLKPSGTVRISVPDLKKLAQIYVAQDEEVLREFLSVLQKMAIRYFEWVTGDGLRDGKSR